MGNKGTRKIEEIWGEAIEQSNNKAIEFEINY